MDGKGRWHRRNRLQTKEEIKVDSAATVKICWGAYDGGRQQYYGEAGVLEFSAPVFMADAGVYTTTRVQGGVGMAVLSFSPSRGTTLYKAYRTPVVVRLLFKEVDFMLEPLLAGDPEVTALTALPTEDQVAMEIHGRMNATQSICGKLFMEMWTNDDAGFPFPRGCYYGPLYTDVESETEAARPSYREYFIIFEPQAGLKDTCRLTDTGGTTRDGPCVYQLALNVRVGEINMVNPREVVGIYTQCAGKSGYATVCGPRYSVLEYGPAYAVDSTMVPEVNLTEFERIELLPLDVARSLTSQGLRSDKALELVPNMVNDGAAPGEEFIQFGLRAWSKDPCLGTMKNAATGNLWCLYGLMLLVKLQRDGRGAAELWRAGVRATSRVPLQKVGWLLNLAACEARAIPGEAPEEDGVGPSRETRSELGTVGGAGDHRDLEQRAELVERLILVKYADRWVEQGLPVKRIGGIKAATRAKVHRRLSPEQLQRISVSELCYRPLQSSDMDEMIALHQEWFPVSYDKDFYNMSVSGSLYSLVAVVPPSPENSADSTEEENILGMITVSTYCEHHKEAISHVLGTDCEQSCRGLRADGAEEGRASGALAYILTLGIAENFRRRGLARELIKRSVEHVENNMPTVQAVFLHVVTYNTAAIELYESSQFLRIEYFPNFYFLHGKHYDSYLYAQYLHGGRPPWKWRMRNFASTWSRWVFSYWTGWRWPSCEGGPEGSSSS
eukprot:s1674_g4.t1